MFGSEAKSDSTLCWTTSRFVLDDVYASQNQTQATKWDAKAMKNTQLTMPTAFEFMRMFKPQRWSVSRTR